MAPAIHSLRFNLPTPKPAIIGVPGAQLVPLGPYGKELRWDPGIGGTAKHEHLAECDYLRRLALAASHLAPRPRSSPLRSHLRTKVDTQDAGPRRAAV